MGEFVVAVDVGTGSARAGVYDRKGALIARAMRPIAMNRESSLTAEHNSTDIWAAVTSAIDDALTTADIDRMLVDAIGFDATCSLVFLNRDGVPLSVTENGAPGWDTIAWLDHRAIDEAAMLTSAKLPALDYVGGIMSPEMQLPKIMWVKAHLPDVWAETGIILDLADYMTFRATGSLARSASTLTPKWNFLNHQASGWDRHLLEQSGLPDLVQKAGISGKPVPAGSAIGTLNAETAAALGLPLSCKVAAGMIDAFAGALSLTGTNPEMPDAVSMVGGTSSCVMRFSTEPQFIRSFWGPFFGAGLDDRWVLEGGQSATGALLDQLIRTHFGREATVELHQQILGRITELLAANADLGKEIHILPDFHGNRSPLGDARSLGVIHGLRLDSSFDGVSTLYYRAMVSLALGIRQIIELMETHGAPIRSLHLGGGHAKNAVLAHLYADATGRDVVISSGDEAMLHGTAMTAASAAGWHPSLGAAASAMKRPTKILSPKLARAKSLDRDYRIFLKMQEQRRELESLV
jgi:FGGY-family pentulose kinase